MNIQQLQAYWEAKLIPSKRDVKRARRDALNYRESVSLEAAGLVEAGRVPIHGYQSCHRIVEWLSDGMDARYETN